ncbi:PREDICTED: protein FAM124B [Lepidothrix coronata]|uniref:Protein FAM124B n=1 Tax=Lepidothrix coronata TaxID=321398 RepID=A0A6J0HU97_9PASS|nr:PREDICTED: protein FAM124B [Lepidothrix coronata]XP_017677761.1 PREDICTED: protein FAM124B [Lepidothrix coronata]XP_017677762.1 PREDICTED: protein FAM124B [Lepidothrix coronata]
MDDGAESLMTVHLLAHLGHSLLLQQTLDRLLEWICLDIRLFLVSERITPLKYYERYRRRNCGFPGISVLLFLHEDLGEERILQVHEQFQHPPWRYQCAQITNGQSHPYAPAHQDFYALDDRLPVWGIRRVHCGPEILRVTLYCSFDNYEDAVRLYEMILQKEATVQKTNFSVFVLHATQHVAVQLCLKQLPIGVAAEPRDSSALQFKVQEIGQLVPLLPNPCVPISSTRWQTQDYEGNTILLQVQNSSKYLEANIGLSHQHNNTGSRKILQDFVPAPLPVTQGNPGRRSQEVRAVKGKTKSDQNEVLAPEQAGGDLHRHLCSSHSVPAARWWWDAPSLRRQVSSRMRAPPQESHRRRRATETNVDTGLAVVSPVSGRCPLNHFSRALRSSLLQLQAPRDGAGSALPSQDRTQLPFAAAERSQGAGQRALGCHSHTPQASPANRAEDEEEEFFI